MKRTPLARGTSQMKRTPLERGTPLRKRGLKPILRAGGVAQNPKFLKWVRTLPCLLAGRDCEGIVQAAHVGDRTSGIKAPDETAIPLCRWHHLDGPDAHHKPHFWDKHGLSRDEVVARYQRWFAAQSS